MDEVEVKVVELKIRKRFFESFERCLVTAASIPDLAGHENVFTLDAGILDPAKVTRSALQNATSVASTLLTTESVVANIKEDVPAMPANPGMGMGM